MFSYLSQTSNIWAANFSKYYCNDVAGSQSGSITNNGMKAFTLLFTHDIHGGQENMHFASSVIFNLIIKYQNYELFSNVYQSKWPLIWWVKKMSENKEAVKDIQASQPMPHKNYKYLGRNYKNHWGTHLEKYHYMKLDINSLAPENCGYNLELNIFELISRIDIPSISCEIALRGMPQGITDD